LQGKAVTHWKKVLQKYSSDADKTHDNFMEILKDYLEKVQNVKNIGNQVIRQMQEHKKPALMPFEDYLACHDQLWSYLNSAFLRYQLSRRHKNEPSKCY